MIWHIDEKIVLRTGASLLVNQQEDDEQLAETHEQLIQTANTFAC